MKRETRSPPVAPAILHPRNLVSNAHCRLSRHSPRRGIFPEKLCYFIALAEGLVKAKGNLLRQLA
jgi:hypothetical protein